MVQVGRDGKGLRGGHVVEMEFRGGCDEVGTM